MRRFEDLPAYEAGGGSRMIRTKEIKITCIEHVTLHYKRRELKIDSPYDKQETRDFLETVLEDLRVRESESRQPHKLEIVGSTPTLATI